MKKRILWTATLDGLSVLQSPRSGIRTTEQCIFLPVTIMAMAMARLKLFNVTADVDVSLCDCEYNKYSPKSFGKSASLPHVRVCTLPLHVLAVACTMRNEALWSVA